MFSHICWCCLSGHGRKMIHFLKLFGFPMTNFGPLTRRQLHSCNVHHCTYFLSWLKGHQVPHNKVWFQSLADCSRYKQRTLWYWWWQAILMCISSQNYIYHLGWSISDIVIPVPNIWSNPSENRYSNKKYVANVCCLMFDNPFLTSKRKP